MMDRNELRLVQKQLQKLALTPKMQQALHLLQIPMLELKELLREEMVKNPLLEETEEDEEFEGAEEKEEASVEAEPEKKEKEENIDTLLDRLSQLDENWQEYFQGSGTEDSNMAKVQRKHDFSVDASSVKPDTLHEHLTEQLRLSTSVQKELRIGEHIIGCIDDNGYLQALLPDIAKALEVSLADVEKVLALIQGFDPIGVGARDLKECLLLQLKSKRMEGMLPAKIVENHMDKIEKKKFKEIAKALSVPLEEVIAAVNIISTLEPKPGRSFSGERIQYILPDIFLRKLDDEYVIIINDEEIPRLKISPRYKNLLRDKGVDQSTKKYLKDKLTTAIWMIQNVEYRKRTLYRVTEAIVNSQKEFLDKGLSYLKPMSLQEIADKIGMHESTVSRVIANKYMDTPQGLFGLRYFFTRGMKNGSEGEFVSVETIKQMIRKFVERESPDNPVTDEKIRKELIAEGMSISRRTVAKYREELKLLSSNHRKSGKSYSSVKT